MTTLDQLARTTLTHLTGCACESRHREVETLWSNGTTTGRAPDPPAGFSLPSRGPISDMITVRGTERVDVAQWSEADSDPVEDIERAIDMVRASAPRFPHEGARVSGFTSVNQYVQLQYHHGQWHVVGSGEASVPIRYTCLSCGSRGLSREGAARLLNGWGSFALAVSAAAGYASLELPPTSEEMLALRACAWHEKVRGGWALGASSCWRTWSRWYPVSYPSLDDPHVYTFTNTRPASRLVEAHCRFCPKHAPPIWTCLVGLDDDAHLYFTSLREDLENQVVDRAHADAVAEGHGLECALRFWAEHGPTPEQWEEHVDAYTARDLFIIDDPMRIDPINCRCIAGPIEEE